MKYTQKNKFLVGMILMSLLLALFTGSCKKSDAVDDNNDNTPPVEGVSVRNIAMDFSEIDSTGNNFTLSSLKGKVVLLVVSAMWCGPCRSEVDDLIEIYNNYKEQGLEVVQCVFQDEDSNWADREDINRWIKEFGINFLVFNDPDGSMVNLYNVGPIPLNIVINRDFIITYRFEGFDKDYVIQKIEEAL